MSLACDAIALGSNQVEVEMYVLGELVFSDSYMYFDLNLNAIIIKLHDEAIYIYSF
jgi:hypothetical protein